MSLVVARPPPFFFAGAPTPVFSQAKGYVISHGPERVEFVQLKDWLFFISFLGAACAESALSKEGVCQYWSFVCWFETNKTNILLPAVPNSSQPTRSAFWHSLVLPSTDLPFNY